MTGLYIHIPYCKRKCFYCDFYSVARSPSDSFLSSLVKEFKLREYNREEIGSIFIGGGTPSLMSEQQIKMLFKAVGSSFDIGPDCEITIECNPFTLNPTKLEAIKSAGGNRLSIGVQSFNDAELRFLQRLHDGAMALSSVEMARKAGFSNISIDLMFGLPGQTTESLEQSIDQGLALGIQHVSAYSLIYEAGTPLYEEWQGGRVSRIDQETDAEMYGYLIDRLNGVGFYQYEISNFCRAGYECRHNLNYWERGEYLAYGPAAHGFYGGRRYGNIAQLGKYIELVDKGRVPEEYSEKPDAGQELTEYIFLGLRARGLSLSKTKQLYGQNVEKCLINFVELNIYKDYFANEQDCIRLNKEGYMLCDKITADMLDYIDTNMDC